MDRRQRRELRREALAKAIQYAREGKSVDQLQADMLDDAEQKDGDIEGLIALFVELLPLLLKIFAMFG